MPRVNTYEPTELEALEAAHEAVLYVIWELNEVENKTPAEEAYHTRLLNSAYWLRNRLGVLRTEVGQG